MNILVLSPYSNRIIGAINAAEDHVIATQEKVSACFCADNGVDFIVSYGYRYIIPKPVLDCVNRRAINLHISYLPFSRGAHPIVWSIAEGNPLGVTIHMIDEHLDTGDILFQRMSTFDAEMETFATCHSLLSREIEELFAEKWAYIRSGLVPAFAQDGAGTYHRSSDLQTLKAHMPNGWNTPVSKFKKSLAELGSG